MAELLETTVDDSLRALVEYDSDEMSNPGSQPEHMEVQAEFHQQQSIESIEEKIEDLEDTVVNDKNQQKIMSLEKSKSKRIIIFC